jgi:hypothetical protein
MQLLTVGLPAPPPGRPASTYLGERSRLRRVVAVSVAHSVLQIAQRPAGVRYSVASECRIACGPSRATRVGGQPGRPAGPADQLPLWAVAVSADGARAVSGGTVRVWDLAAGTEVARWTGDYPIIACTPLSGQPFKIAVGQRQGQPYLLELRGQENAT